VLRAFFLAILPLFFAATEFKFQEAQPNYQFRFPRDHFDHPNFRTEWWYYTGNLTSSTGDSKGQKFGFELVFFRQGERRGKIDNPSAWRVDDIYLAHAAVTDISGKHFAYAERLNRAGPGIAGVSADSRRVWNGNWQAQWNGDRQTLFAIADDFRFTLSADSSTPPVIHGIDGISQKADGPGRASHYVSLPRLSVTGQLNFAGKTSEVTGLAWMDHEWFTEQLDETQQGWDWFSVQLEDHTELMLFDLRRKDGSIDHHSAGTFIDRNGKSRHLTSADFSLQPIDYWKSPKTGTRYPVKWKLRVPSLSLSLDCTAALPEQELIAKQGTTTYWEGAVTYSGSRSGVGYLEMTGYDRPVQMK
jgi:predicted secreted hydrolase